MTTTIPASAIVSINPSVLSAGGTPLGLNGLFITNSIRPPVGSVLQFSSSADVGSYFGLASDEYIAAQTYFSGFTNSSIKPSLLLFAQFPTTFLGVPAYVRSATLSGLTLAQLQALSGTLIVAMNGVTKTSSTITLSGATSFSNAASIIQIAFAAYDAITTAASTIAAGTATSVSGSINNNILTVSSIGSGALVTGGVLSGTGVTAGTYITEQLTGTTGNVGTYRVSIGQVTANTTITQTYGLLTVAAMAAGTLAVGQVISGGTTALGSTITALGTGTGGSGTYIVSGGSQTVSATTISAGPLTVAYDSQLQAFVLFAGTNGAAGTMGAVSGTIATALGFTAATGAISSPGSAKLTPAVFMAGIVANTTNWATFLTIFDPDFGFGNAQKLLFAAWNSSIPGDDFVYLAWDADPTPALSSQAVSSLGYLLIQNANSGTTCISTPTYVKAAFVSGAIASINFIQRQGRATLCFKSQANLVADVNNQTVSANLTANGYNYYGVFATATQPFNFLRPGTITGAFKWLDSYVNQIWLNNALQQALMTLLTSVLSIPYNRQGYNLVEAACMDPINAALNFGAIQPGIPLSVLQAVTVNTAAGINISTTLGNRGWYLQILPASALSRGNRTTPPINLWYMDGGSIQQINLASVEVQ